MPPLTAIPSPWERCRCCRELLRPSASVALHRHSNALVDILPPEADSTISVMSQTERPDVTYQVCVGGAVAEAQCVRLCVCAGCGVGRALCGGCMRV